MQNKNKQRHAEFCNGRWNSKFPLEFSLTVFLNCFVLLAMVAANSPSPVNFFASVPRRVMVFPSHQSRLRPLSVYASAY